MPITLKPKKTISVGDVDVAAFNFTQFLDAAELLTGTPTVTEVTTTDLTLSNKAVNTAELVIDGATVAVGKAVQFKIAGQQQGEYRIRVSVGTNATLARTKVFDILLEVI